MNRHSIDTVRAALSHIPPSMPRDDWARVAMAIKSEFPDSAGFELFDQWSATDADGYDPKAARATWRSVKAAGGVTIATVLHMAQERGFKLPEAERAALAPSAAELGRQRADREARARAERLQRETEQQAAAEMARDLWDAAQEAGAADHPYLRRKGVGAHGLRVNAAGELLVPLRDAEGVLWNTQRILPARPAGGGSDKYFQKGGRVTGLWHWIGNPASADVVLVAEGYATAASVHAATGRPVAAAFNANNLKPVAMALRKAMPTVQVGVCGDDDRATQLRSGKNPGADAARIAAARVRGFCVLPHGLPAGASDFNDLQAARGADAVRAQVEAAIAAHMATRPVDASGEQASPPPAATPADDKGPDPFIVSGEGVHWQGFDREGNPTKPMWLCSRLEVIARTRDADGGEWGLLLCFTDPVGRVREWAMPMRMLSGDGRELRSILYSMGLRISTSPAARNKLTEYLQTRDPDELAVCTDRTGWHPTAEGGGAYVLPHQTIGDGVERIVYQSDAPMENTFRQRGSADAWRERVAALCVGNSRLLFAVSCAFAGPLMRPSGTDSGGFHLRGDSSSGKTTALRVAASVYGAPGYMQRWRTTDNALEAIAAQHCDGLLILDELAQVDPKTAGECAYMLANEQSKARATRNAAPRPRLTWRLLFLSAGELGLADHMAEAMKRARVGQEVRMVDLVADAGAGMGAFENLHDREGGAALANELQRATAATYGAAGLAWLQWLAPQWSALPKMLRRRTDALRAAWVPEGSSGQVERVAARFALVAVAGELATEAGLTGWPAGDVARAARTCFESWLAARGGTGNAEVVAMLRQVRQFIGAHGSSRFAWTHKTLLDGADKTLHRAGFRRLVTKGGKPIARSEWEISEANGDAQMEYLVLSETFQKEVCAGFDPAAVARVLQDHDCLIAPEKGRNNTNVYVPGEGNVKCYRIQPKIMELDL